MDNFSKLDKLSKIMNILLEGNFTLIQKDGVSYLKIKDQELKFDVSVQEILIEYYQNKMEHLAVNTLKNDKGEDNDIQFSKS